MTRFLTRSYSFLSLSLMLDAWRDAGACAAVTGVPDCVHDVEYARTAWCLDSTWIDGFSRKYLDAEPDLFWGFLRRGQETGLRLSAVSRHLFEGTGPGPNVPSEKALRNFLTFTKHFQENAAFILVTHPLARSVELRLLDALRTHGVPAERLDQALLDLSMTRKSNAAEEEAFDLLVIQRRMGRPGFDLAAELEEHTRRHAYVKYREPFSGGYTVEEFRSRLSEKLALPDYFQPQAEVIGRFGAEERGLVELQEEMVFYRTFRTERSYEALFYLERFLAGLEEANGLPPHELSFTTMDELALLLRSGQRVDPAVTGERRRDFAMHLHDGTVSILTGPSLEQSSAGRSAAATPPATEVRGLSAYRGLATGRARVVMNAADQDVVAPGDVLIVPMTTPDLLPAMQKAAAFVTDEGGVICHAAIIARELKKPCVIGTRRATAEFRNGDLVEVNGFTGVVRLVAGPK